MLGMTLLNLHMAERQLTHLAVLQSHRIAGVRMGADAVHPDQFTGHKKTGYLIATILRSDSRFEKTGADGEKGMERLARTEQKLAFFQPVALSDNGVQLLEFIGTQADGQAQLAQRTGRTKRLHRL